ncbi:hypothetical protein [Ferroplasma acidarmanus]|uniref:Dnd system-associated protein 4 n=1 Tax=Ferroplasma acidarmanus Fer1 TaxID=333146 RepID=S0AP70_FERAC|nr:hypothetical protein [Ferroplasma acidarmanus]AGO59994.1 hypothetical protein FACI_IFERC00001G0014 [Ferroplasma acidarmanus Fer1]
MTENTEPVLLYIDKKYKSKEDQLLHNTDSIFKKAGNKLGNKDLFMLALVTGFQASIKYPIESRAEFDLRVVYLNESEKALIKAIAIKETGDFNIISNPLKYYTIAEEYVNAGIDILYDLGVDKDYKNYMNNLENQLFNLVKG